MNRSHIGPGRTRVETTLRYWLYYCCVYVSRDLDHHPPTTNHARLDSHSHEPLRRRRRSRKRTRPETEHARTHRLFLGSPPLHLPRTHFPHLPSRIRLSPVPQTTLHLPHDFWHPSLYRRDRPSLPPRCSNGFLPGMYMASKGALDESGFGIIGVCDDGCFCG